MYTDIDKITSAKASLSAWYEMVIGKPIQPYQKQIIEFVKKGGKPSLRIRPQQSPKRMLHRLSLDELIGGVQIEKGSVIQSFRPMQMIIDDPIAPQRFIGVDVAEAGKDVGIYHDEHGSILAVHSNGSETK